MDTDSSSSEHQAELAKDNQRRREELGLYPGWWLPESENGQRLFSLFLDEDSETEDEDEE